MATSSKSEKPSAKQSGTRETKKIRYAVIGLGNIAQVAVLPAFANAKKNSELVALISDDEDKLKKLARKYKVKHTYNYSQYEECLKSGLVDAVYIALPNHLHREYTERAAACGIHVLCEKPLAMTAKDAKAMIEATKKAGVQLMTAYRLHFQKANLEAVRMVQNGEIGEPRTFNSTFSMRVREGDIRIDREIGGGPLYDIGIYCINATRYLFREVPTEVFAFSSRGLDERFTETDEMVSASLRYGNGKIATFTCSFAGAPVAYYEVVGTEGVVCLDQAYEYTEDMELEFVSAKGKSKKRTFKKADQFAPELLYFSECVLEGRSPEPGGLEGLLDVEIIEALQKSLKTGRPVKLDLQTKTQHANPAQAITKRPLRQPKPVHAPSPSID